MRRIKHAKTALVTPSIAYTDWNDWLVDEAGAIVDLGDLSYYHKVLSVAPSKRVAYWPLWDDSGAVAEDHSGHDASGVFSVASKVL